MVCVYGMRLRGFSLGCQPMAGLINHYEDSTGVYYDILEYNRALTDQEQREYELDSFSGMSNGGEKTWHINSDFRNNKLYVTGPYPSEGTETYILAYDLYHLETDVVAETKEDAIKIANDRFAKKRAEMIGL